MSDDLKIREAIAHGEDWFSQVCGRSEPVDTDAIKQRVRIEIGEQWLARKLSDTDDPQLADRIRAKVRASIGDASLEIETSRETGRGRSTVYRPYWVAGSAAGIAAMLLLTFGDLLEPATSVIEVTENIEASYVDAFEQYEGDDWDTSFDKLSDEFDSYASASGSGSDEWGSDDSDGWFEAETDGVATDG